MSSSWWFAGAGATTALLLVLVWFDPLFRTPAARRRRLEGVGLWAFFSVVGVAATKVEHAEATVPDLAAFVCVLQAALLVTTLFRPAIVMDVFFDDPKTFRAGTGG